MSPARSTGPTAWKGSTCSRRSPLGLDFFGDTIEGMRSFDALTQRTTGAILDVTLKPVNEVLLDETAIHRFRTRYREQFGTVADDDPLYEAVSAGHRYIGMEHWLPLYYESLETIFDYLPGAAVALDHQADEVRADRFASIADFYTARREVGAVKGAPIYRPIVPKQLFLDEAEWESVLRQRAMVQLSPFAAANAEDGGGRPGFEFSAARADPERNLFDAVREKLHAETSAGHRVLIAAYSTGSAERLGSLLKEHGAGEARAVEHWDEFRKLPRDVIGLAVLAIERGYGFADTALVTEQDILGDRLSRPARRSTNYDQFVAEVSTLTPGDLVVHAEHGIGRYDGLVTLDVAGAPHDCLRVLYASDDKLFVPVENIEALSRYGSEDAAAQLDRLGAASWQSRKSRVKKRIKDIADELIAIAAQRQLKDGETLTPPEGLWSFATTTEGALARSLRAPAGPDGPAHARVAAAPRHRDRGSYSPGHQGHLRRRARVALPRAASARTRGLGARRMARLTPPAIDASQVERDAQ